MAPCRSNLPTFADVLPGGRPSLREAVVQIRPEAEQKLRAGFQRRVDQQRDRYAVQLAHAGQQAAWFECGEVAGVFSAKAGGGVRPRAYVVGLLPMAAIPVLIGGAPAGIPG